MFSLHRVSKRYDGQTALAELILTIPPGQRVAVVGPSGSGKTTLLNLLAVAIRPDEGEVSLDGRPASQLRPGPQLARLVGMIHQELDLVEALPVVHNVLAGRLGEWGFWRSLVSLISPRELDRAHEALARVGIPDKLRARTADLSGGEKQRVAIARLLLQRPRAILADEPVSSLDPARAQAVVELLNDVASEAGQTLVASLHSVDLALRHFSRIIALRKGRLYFDRPACEVRPEDLHALYELE